MAPRTLLHAHSTPRLQRTAIAGFLNNQQHGRCLILAPNRLAADDLVRDAQALLGCERMTLTQLAAAVAGPALVEQGLRPASRLAMEALTARVIAAAQQANELSYFEPVAATPGFSRAVTSTLTELRLEDITPEELQSQAGAPGADLSHLLEAFEESRERDKLADLPALLDLACSVLDQAETAEHGIGLPLLILDVPLPARAHREFLRRVIDRSPSVMAVALTGDADGIRHLASILQVEPQQTDVDAGPLDGAAAALFAPSATAHPDAPIEFFSAAGEGLECVEIARRLRRLAESGVPFDHAAILLRSPERYQPLVEEALRRASIPSWFSRGVARPDPAGRAFLALIACAQERCSATRFAEYLSLGQVPEIDSELAPPAALQSDDEVLASFLSAQGAAPALEPEPSTYVAAPVFWERLIVDAAVVGGRARWQRRLRGLEAEFRFQLASLQRENSPKAEHTARQIERLRSLSKFALPLIAELDTLPTAAVWGDWIERLTGLARIALKRPEAVWSVLDELRAMEDIGPVDLGEVYQVLAEKLRFLRRDTGNSRYGRVFVGGIAEARGRSFGVVFLPGLSEGLFPARPVEDPILLDAHREALREDLRTQVNRVADERLLLHQAIGAARDRLVYSYPRMDVMQNRPRVPSFYALELIRASRGKLPDLRGFEREAAEAAPTRLDWPAPRNPQEAIDDAEFDLATLGHIMQLPAKDAKGTAHYLVEANSHLVRSLRNRARRWRGSWFNVDGLVKPGEPALKHLSDSYSLTKKPYSPSSLQQYAECPYRFYLYAVLGLEPREEPAALERLDPLTRGELFHLVQRELLEELKHAKQLPVTPATLPAALQALDAVLDRKASEYAEDKAPAIDRVWRSEVEELRTDLRGWLQHVALHDTAWTPEHFELEFKKTPILNQGYLVRGAIDVVETNAAGSLRITDHKTGLFPKQPPVYVAGGKTLQPILYSLAASAELDKPVSSGRLYFCTRRGDYQEVDIRNTPEAAGYLETVLKTVDTAVTQGFLPAAPAHEACDRCDYSNVCGPYEELRVSRKQRSALDSLKTLRSLP